MSRKPVSPHRWKINLECVYRRDRQERLQQIFAVVVHESLVNLEPCKEEEPNHENNKCSTLCQSLQQ